MIVTLPNFLIIILGSIAASLLGIFIVRRTIHGDFLRLHHEVTDPVLAVLGTLFAILLGFMLANSMQRFEAARTNIEQEAGAVGDLYRLSAGLPEKQQHELKRTCRDYANVVVNDEWALMKTGTTSERAWSDLDDAWSICMNFEPVTQKQSNIHEHLIDSVSKLGECRRTRFAELQYSLPHTLWFIVIFGALSTIGFTYFFAVTSLKLQVLMTSVITIIIGLNVYMLAGYDAPFNGDIALQPDALMSVIKIIEREDSPSKQLKQP